MQYKWRNYVHIQRGINLFFIYFFWGGEGKEGKMSPLEKGNLIQSTAV